MRFIVHKNSSPKWEHAASANTVDEILDYLRVVHRVDKFIVDFNPWEGFAYDASGHILRDEHGIGIREHSGDVWVTICD